MGLGGTAARAHHHDVRPDACGTPGTPVVLRDRLRRSPENAAERAANASEPRVPRRVHAYRERHANEFFAHRPRRAEDQPRRFECGLRVIACTPPIHPARATASAPSGEIDLPRVARLIRGRHARMIGPADEAGVHCAAPHVGSRCSCPTRRCTRSRGSAGLMGCRCGTARPCTRGPPTPCTWGSRTWSTSSPPAASSFVTRPQSMGSARGARGASSHLSSSGPGDGEAVHARDRYGAYQASLSHRRSNAALAR